MNEPFDGIVKSGRGNRSSSLTTAALRGILQVHPLERGLSKSAGRLNLNSLVSKDCSSRKKKRKDIRRLTMPALLCSGKCQLLYVIFFVLYWTTVIFINI